MLLLSCGCSFCFLYVELLTVFGFCVFDVFDLFLVLCVFFRFVCLFGVIVCFVSVVFWCFVCLSLFACLLVLAFVC